MIARKEGNSDCFGPTDGSCDQLSCLFCRDGHKRGDQSDTAERRTMMARVLLVDDEEHIRRYYTDELSDEGHEVSTLATGDNLLRKIEQLQPEVVILDIRLVDHDGLELLQEIRSRHYQLPVIICTAYDTYRYDQKAISADYYVVKSFDLSDLKMAIRRAIEADSAMGLTESC